MWIFSKKYGLFNTDNLSAILPPADEFKLVYAYNSGQGFRVTEGEDNYNKILLAIADNTHHVAVS